MWVRIVVVMMMVVMMQRSAVKGVVWVAVMIKWAIARISDQTVHTEWGDVRPMVHYGADDAMGRGGRGVGRTAHQWGCNSHGRRGHVGGG